MLSLHEESAEVTAEENKPEEPTEMTAEEEENDYFEEGNEE